MEQQTNRRGDGTVARHRKVLFLLAMSSPILFSLLRKFVPGQSAGVEAAANIVVLAVFLYMIPRLRFPRPLGGALLLLFLFQFAYALPALYESPVFGVSVLVTRFAPMMLFPIAYSVALSVSDLKRYGRALQYVSFVLLCGGVYFLLYGRASLPFIFQPIQTIFDAGRLTRSGIPVYVGCFATRWIFSWFLLAVFFLFLALASDKNATQRARLIWLVSAASVLFMTYLSTRRAVFYMCSIGLLYYFIGAKFATWLRVAGLISALAVLVLVNQFGPEARGSYDSSVDYVADVDMNSRMDNVFWRHTDHALDHRPWGKFLGSNGPESKVLRGGMDFPVEVGSAMLIAETGLVGNVLFVCVEVVVFLTIWRRAAMHPNTVMVRMFGLFVFLYSALFYTKEYSALANVCFGQFAYWGYTGIAAAFIRPGRPGEPLQQVPKLRDA